MKDNMQGEKLVVKKYHTHAAKEIAKILMQEVGTSSSKYVIAIAGESGAGKTVIAHELSKILKKNKIENILLGQDDYFRYPPKTTHTMRRRDIFTVGTSEIKLSLLNKHAKNFKDPKTTKIQKPLVSLTENKIGKETIKCKTAQIMIIEGTYASLIKNADIKVFLASTFKDTFKGRKSRKREQIDKLNKRILTIEHQIISQHKKRADIIVEKDFSLTDKRKATRKVKRICMLTIHGYVDPRPTLGKTDTGGQVTYVIELSKALAVKGIKIDIFTRQFQGRKSIEYVNKNVRIIRIPCGGKKFIPKEKLLPYLDTYVNNMEKFIKKEGIRYDIFHSHYWDAGYAAMKLTERFNYFFVHTFHSLGAWKREHMGGEAKKMEKLYRFKERVKFEKIIYKKVRSLVMTSTEMVKNSRELYGYKSKNYVILPAGVNTKIYYPLKKGKRDKKIDVPQNYIFWVGRFDTNKGLDYLLRAFAGVVTKAKDLFLVIGGGSKHPKPKEKKLRKDLHRLIEKKQIKNRVFFTGHIKDDLMPTYYRKAKFFVLPSKFEPFGMTAAEAMACGIPVIISERAGIRKYLDHGYDCLIVNPANKKDLSAAFRLLVSNDTLRKRIARNGLKFAQSEFSWSTIADKSVSYYNDLIR